MEYHKSIMRLAGLKRLVAGLLKLFFGASGGVAKLKIFAMRQQKPSVVRCSMNTGHTKTAVAGDGAYIAMTALTSRRS